MSKAEMKASDVTDEQVRQIGIESRAKARSPMQALRRQTVLDVVRTSKGDYSSGWMPLASPRERGHYIDVNCLFARCGDAGITKAEASKILDELVADGLVELMSDGEGMYARLTPDAGEAASGNPNAPYEKTA